MESSNIPSVVSEFRKHLELQGYKEYMIDFLVDQAIRVYQQIEALNKMTTFQFKLIENESV